MFIGKMPTREDFDEYVRKAKDIGQDRLKEIEDASKRVLEKVEKARKEGKSQADAFLSGVKEGEQLYYLCYQRDLKAYSVAAPQDVDSLIKQLKDAAKKAGLPADTAESWIKSKVQDGKIDAEEMVRNVQLVSGWSNGSLP
jgi:vacuolar-type H+-ATPase subunit H